MDDFAATLGPRFSQWNWLWGACFIQACVQTSGCPLFSEVSFPGDQDMGAYVFEATVEAAQCALTDGAADAGFSFHARFTQDKGTAQAFVTSDGLSRDAAWDGQVLSSLSATRRYFVECTACQTRLEESMTIALLSRSQAQVLGGRCPSDALDGGLPVPDADAGIESPGIRALGFDAVLACGELTTRTAVDMTTVGDAGLGGAGQCPQACDECEVRYRLEGIRR